MAEYTALVMGMETALQRGVRHLTIMCDSELVFNQVGQILQPREIGTRLNISFKQKNRIILLSLIYKLIQYAQDSVWHCLVSPTV